MKKTLAALLSALILLSPLPSYAQSVPQVGGGGPIVLPVGAAAAGVPGAGAGVASPQAVLGSSALVLPKPVVPAPAAIRNAGLQAGAAAAGSAAPAVAGAVSAAKGGRAAGSAAAVRPAASAEGVARAVPAAKGASEARRGERPSTLSTVRELAADLDPKAGSKGGFGRLANAFDAARRTGRAAEEAPEAPNPPKEAPEASALGASEPAAEAAQATPEAAPEAAAPATAPKAAPGWLQSLGRHVAGSAVAQLLPAGVVVKLNGGERPVPAPSNYDEWGGPKPELLTTREQVLRGLKWAFNLIGITAILSWTVGVLQHAYPWPLYLPDALLQASGRVELLTQFGPQAIMEALANSPIGFLLVKVPLAVLSETWAFHLKGFGITFLSLAALRPAAGWVSAKLANLPDLFSFVTIARRFVEAVGRVSNHAFGIAAFSAAVGFAVAHAAEWGANPLVLSVQGLAGYLLARLAYTARPAGAFPAAEGSGLKARAKWLLRVGAHVARYGVAPFVAHATFAIATLVAPLLVVHGFASAGAVFGTVLSIMGVVALYYNARVHFKWRKLSTTATSAFLALVLAVQAVGTFQSPVETVRLMDGKPAIVQLQHEHGPVVQTPVPEEAKPAVQAEAAAQQLPDKPVEVLVKELKPAVVTIYVGGGLGSGVIVDPGGLIVTNEHVVRSAGVGAQVKVKLSDGRMIPGMVLAMNGDRDLALVALPQNPHNPQPYPSAPMAPPGTLEEGQTIVTMGSPLGLPFTVSKGIVSGLGLRGVSPTYRVQIDAPISPGNSGGPLFDLKGRLVGINGAGMPKGGDLNFSIPVEEVHRAIAQFKATGRIQSSYLGVIFQVGDGKMGEGPGVMIEHVRPGSAAARAGLLSGDVIVGVDGKTLPPPPMMALNGLFLKLGSADPGDEVALMVLRPQASGVPSPIIVKVTLDAK